MNDRVRILIDEVRKLTGDEQEQMLAALLDAMDDASPDRLLDRQELRRRQDDVRSGKAVTIEADLALRAVRMSLRRTRSDR